MKFEVKDRYTGEVQFVADIDCDENTKTSVKLGLAVRWAVANGANLKCADLENADLEYAYLAYVDLENANLEGANLGNARLNYANLGNARLKYANLGNAYLGYANLEYANLGNANLECVNLESTTGNKKQIKTLKIDVYDVAYTHDILQIGCQRHAIMEWWEFDDKRILEMDGKEALKWWRKWKPILQQIIEASPAEKE